MKKKLKCFVCHKEVNEEDDYVFKGQTVHKGECLKSMIAEYNAVRNLQIRNKRLCAEIERLNNECDSYMKIATQKQIKIDKAIEWIEQYEKQIGILGETSKSIVLTDDVVIGNLLDILKEDK